ncbi:hypothetical protein [Pseudonocardia sp. N23]|uniref:hypothetical protein n=1 Tax=Pseudonocardia sp. N23 TaxID=1987376 RepID=UPI000BFB4C29|nr:hypothetical protein [Pseudonocardia sp. N23]GAY11048.1 translation initiation factor 2 [Pseudonocardia sp. N23]
MTGIGWYRYEGYPLAEKFKWLGEGPGSSAIGTLHQGMTNIGGKFADSDQELRRQLEPLGIAWQGRAASGAGAAVTSATVRAAAHADAGRSAGTSVDGYGVSFGEMSRHVGESGRDRIMADVHRAMSMPSGTPYLLLGPAGAPFAMMAAEADHREAVEKVRTLDAKANAALYVHEETSRAAVEQFPVVETAPVAVPPTGGGAGGGLGGGPGGRIGDGVGGPGFGGPPPVGAVGDRSSPTRPPGAGLPALPDPAVRSVDTGVAVPGANGRPDRGVGSVPGRPAVPVGPRLPDPGRGAGRTALPGVTAPGLRRGGTSTGRAFADKLFRAGGPPGVGEPAGRAPGGGREPARTPVMPGRAGGTGLPGGMYPPMGGAAAGRGGNDRHTSRFLVPSSAPFDVETPHVAPVIGGEEQR